jgi:WD40 repeat protein
LGQDAKGGIWVATGDDFGTVRVMRRDRAGVWTAVCAGPWHSELVTDLALAPGADWLVSTSEDGRAALVPLADGQCGTPRYLEPHAGILYSARFAPDGQALVTAAMNASAQVWGLDGTRLAELKGHKDRVSYAEISPDGHWILTSSRDGSVRLWPRPTAPRSQPLEALLSLTAGHGGVSFATFSPDGKSIAGAYRDNTTRLWRVWSEDPKRDRTLESVWGRDRARLVLIREAERFRLDNRL